jgi:hypothetical protein
MTAGIPWLIRAKPQSIACRSDHALKAARSGGAVSEDGGVMSDQCREARREINGPAQDFPRACGHRLRSPTAVTDCNHKCSNFEPTPSLNP